MPGTKEGGKKAARTNMLRHGKDFYKRNGQLGGRKGTTGGFAANVQCSCDIFEEAHAIKHCAGVKGGRTSRRKPGVKKNA